MNKKEIKDKVKRQIEKTIADLTLFDDEFMSKVFDGNIEAAELILKIVLQRNDIKVKQVRGQVELKSAYHKGRDIRLDIEVVDDKGTKFDVEIQRDPRGSNEKRGRYILGMMDVRSLKETQPFKALKETYIIFICQHDKFGAGKPIYHVDKTIKETGVPYEDGAHVIYVNGNYRGDDDFGKLAHDFNCKNADDMYFKPFADGVRHFKETKEGREVMSEAMEKLRKIWDKESEKKTLISCIKNLMETQGWSAEIAMNELKIKDKDRAIIAKMLQKK